jgi:hypothetical protein
MNLLGIPFLCWASVVISTEPTPIELGNPLRCQRVLVGQSCSQRGDVTFVATIVDDALVSVEVLPPMDTPERKLVGDCMLGNPEYYTSWFRRGRDRGNGAFSVTITPRPEYCLR